MEQLGERLGAFERQNLQDMRAQVVALFLPLFRERAHAVADGRREHTQIVNRA